MLMYPLPPVASVADFAQAQARAVVGGAAVANNIAALANPVVPANLVAPSSTPVAVVELPSVGRGRFQFSVTMTFTDSIADTVTAAVANYTAFTPSTGGTVTSGVRWASSAITAAAGTLQGAPGIYRAVFPTTAEGQTMVLSGIAIGVAGIPNQLVFAVSAAGTLSGLNLLVSVREL